MVEVGPSGFNRNYINYFSSPRDEKCQEDYCTLYYETEEAPIDLSKQSNWNHNLNTVKEEKVEVIILPQNDWTPEITNQHEDDEDDANLIIDLKNEPDNEETRSYEHHMEDATNGNYDHGMEDNNGRYDMEDNNGRYLENDLEDNNARYMEDNNGRYLENANDTELEKAMRRKEQNKRAAMVYRIRQKSFCELADQEYDKLMTKNKKLKEQLNNLTETVAYTRNMIDLSVAATKQQLKNEMDLQQQSDTQSECSAAPLMSDFTPVKRPRNNSWPQTRVLSNEKKKEQNKLASKRFRERKKQQIEQVRDEEKLLEIRNKNLKDKQREMETNIFALKHLLTKKKLI